MQMCEEGFIIIHRTKNAGKINDAMRNVLRTKEYFATKLRSPER